MPLRKPQIAELLSKNRKLTCGGESLCVSVAAVAKLPTVFGDFQVVAFDNSVDGKEHLAIVKGDVYGKSEVPVRMHSECLTGDALGSRRCDCRAQLAASLERISALGGGVLLYMRQEGRGIGLLNKMK